MVLTESSEKKYLKRSNGVHRPGASLGPTGLAGQKFRWLTVMSGSLSVLQGLKSQPEHPVHESGSRQSFASLRPPLAPRPPVPPLTPLPTPPLPLGTPQGERERAGRERAGLEGVTWVARRCAVPPRGGGWGIPTFCTNLSSDRSRSGPGVFGWDEWRGLPLPLGAP